MTQELDRPAAWRDANAVTDWEWAEVGRLLCDYTPRDLALKVTRLEEKVKIEIQLRTSLKSAASLFGEEIANGR